MRILVAIDAADVGKFKDLTFTAEGNLAITGDITPGGMPMPAEFENVQGLDNLSGWTLSVNGRTSRAYKAAVSDGRLIIIRKGISISFR